MSHYHKFKNAPQSRKEPQKGRQINSQLSARGDFNTSKPKNNTRVANTQQTKTTYNNKKYHKKDYPVEQRYYQEHDYVDYDSYQQYNYDYRSSHYGPNPQKYSDSQNEDYYSYHKYSNLQYCDEYGYDQRTNFSQNEQEDSENTDRYGPKTQRTENNRSGQYQRAKYNKLTVDTNKNFKQSDETAQANSLNFQGDLTSSRLRARLLSADNAEEGVDNSQGSQGADQPSYCASYYQETSQGQDGLNSLANFGFHSRQDYISNIDESFGHPNKTANVKRVFTKQDYDTQNKDQKSDSNSGKPTRPKKQKQNHNMISPYNGSTEYMSPPVTGGIMRGHDQKATSFFAPEANQEIQLELYPNIEQQDINIELPQTQRYPGTLKKNMIDAKPFYPLTDEKISDANSNNSSSNYVTSENEQKQHTIYDQIGSVKDQMWYQSKFLKKLQQVRPAWRYEDKIQKNNPFAFKGNGRILSKDYKLKIKTELCKSWEQYKKCSYGDQCAFAHGEHELQKKKHVPSRYKTKLCQQYHEQFYCPYGHRCQFIHSQKLSELMKQQQEAAGEGNGTLNDLMENEIKPSISYRQILDENVDCLKQRLISSQNPFLNEFNLIYKEITERLPIFERITSGQPLVDLIPRQDESYMQTSQFSEFQQEQIKQIEIIIKRIQLKIKELEKDYEAIDSEIQQLTYAPHDEHHYRRLEMARSQVFFEIQRSQTDVISLSHQLRQLMCEDQVLPQKTNQFIECENELNMQQQHGCTPKILMQEVQQPNQRIVFERDIPDFM